MRVSAEVQQSAHSCFIPLGTSLADVCVQGGLRLCHQRQASFQHFELTRALYSFSFEKLAGEPEKLESLSLMADPEATLQEAGTRFSI